MSHDWPMYAGQLEARIQELESESAPMRKALQEYVSIRNAKHQGPDSSYLPDRLVELDRMAAAALATDAGKEMQTELACLRAALGWVPLNVREAIRLGDTAKCEAWAKRGLEIHDQALEEAVKVAETLPGKHVMGGHKAAMRIATAIRALKTGGGT